MLPQYLRSQLTSKQYMFLEEAISESIQTEGEETNILESANVAKNLDWSSKDKAHIEITSKLARLGMLINVHAHIRGYTFQVNPSLLSWPR